MTKLLFKMYCNVYVLNLPTDIRRYISKFLPNPIINAKIYRDELVTNHIKKNIKKYITWYDFCINRMADTLDINDFCAIRKSKLMTLVECDSYKNILSIIASEDKFFKRCISHKIIAKIKFS